MPVPSMTKIGQKRENPPLKSPTASQTSVVIALAPTKLLRLARSIFA